MSSHPRSAERPPSVGWALAGLSLSMLMSALDTSIANVALPTFAKAFSASFQAVQWVVLAYLLAVTALIVGAGRLGDLVGRRRLLQGGILLFTAASALCGAALALPVLVAARAAQGLGAATMMALTLAFVGDTVPKPRVGSAMGLLGTMSAVGTALGPSLGGFLIAGAGWRAIFLVNVPIGILNLALVRRFLPADRRDGGAERPAFDWRGTLLLAATLGAYALAMTLGRGHLGPLNLALLAVAALGAALFARAERGAASPLVRLSMLRRPDLGAGLAMSLLVSTVMMATLVVGPFYLARGLRLDAASVGLVMSVGPLVAALTGVPAGRLVDRLGTGAMIIGGLAGIAVGALLLAAAAGSGVLGYLGPIALVTASYALFQAANQTAVMTGIPAEQRGVVSGLLHLARNLGLVTGASLMGAVFTLGSGSVPIASAAPQAVAAGLRSTFGVAVALILLALAVAAGGRSRAALAGGAA